jgi:glycosyltransferase involved in cell wall biosynthesis
VHVASLYGGGATWERLLTAGVPCSHLKKRFRWDVVGPARRLLQVAGTFRPDAVYSFMPAANVLAALLKSRLHSRSLVWGVRAANMDWKFYGVFPRFLVRLETALNRRADLIVCNSIAGRRYHAQLGWNETRMAVIENGFDTNALYPDAAAGVSVREEIGTDSRVKVIGVVGRLDPIKDHVTFFRMAAALLRRTDDSFEFWCVGDGQTRYAQELKEETRRLGIADSVRWLGARLDMRAVYSAMDVTCLTSLSEGFPNVVAESMACGTPCVVFDVGDALSIVGKRSLVVPGRDPDALAAAVQRAYSDHSLRERVRARIETEFSIATCVDRTEEILLRAISAAPR